MVSISITDKWRSSLASNRRFLWNHDYTLAINKNNEELALMLVRRGASVTYRDELGNAPLHEAVRKNQIEVVKVSYAQKPI